MAWSEAQKRYQTSSKGREARNRYQKSPKGIETHKRYMAKQKAKLTSKGTNKITENKRETISEVITSPK